MMNIILFFFLPPLLTMPLMMHAGWKVSLNRDLTLPTSGFLTHIPMPVLWIVFWLSTLVAFISLSQWIDGLPYHPAWPYLAAWASAIMFADIWLLSMRSVSYSHGYLRYTFRRDSREEISFHVKTTFKGARLGRKERITAFLENSPGVLEAACRQMPREVTRFTFDSPWLAASHGKRDRFVPRKVQATMRRLLPDSRQEPVFRVMGTMESLLVTCMAKAARQWRRKIGGNRLFRRLQSAGFSVIIRSKS